jgi:hypothetical protein
VERKDLLQQELRGPQGVTFIHLLMSALRPVRLLEPSELHRRIESNPRKKKKKKKTKRKEFNHHPIVSSYMHGRNRS